MSVKTSIVSAISNASLQARFAALTIGLVLSTAFIIGIVQFRLNTAAQLQSEGERLQADLRMAERSLQDGVAVARQTAGILAATPPIQGIIRAERAGGVDPLDGSSIELWKQRLTQIFEGMARNYPEILQVRYIQAANGGMELVRVNRRGDSVEAVERAKLQPKGAEPYVTQTLAEPPGAIKVFDVNLNREQGRIETPHVPVLRVATPVYADNGEAYGLVVLNLKFRGISAAIEEHFAHVNDFYLASADGGFLLHPDPARTFGFEFGRNDKIQSTINEAAEFLESGAHSRWLEQAGPNGESVGALRRLYFDAADPERFLLAAALTPSSKVLAATFSSRATIFIVAGLLAIFNACLAAYLARRLAQPLNSLTEAARALGEGAAVSTLRLPAARGDEVGNLSRTFVDMAKALEHRQAALELSNRDLTRINTELRDFAYIASHDLREPIRAASSHASMLLQMHGDDLDDAVKKRLKRICALTDKMATLTSCLLEYSRLESNGECELVDTRALIKEISDDLAEYIAEHNAEIVVADDLPDACGNAPHLRIVFQNLIVNGIKYNTSQKRRIEIGWSPHTTRNALEAVRFSVSDNGVGIDKEQHENVFKIFKRLNREDVFGTGTGAGLAFVKRLVESQQGEVWLESEPGHGSTFYFTNSGHSDDG